MCAATATRPTGGFGVELVGAGEKAGAFVLQYRETRPAPDAITAQVITSPFHIVRLARGSGTIEFRRVEGP